MIIYKDHGDHLVDERDSFVVLFIITEIFHALHYPAKCQINWRSLKMEKVHVNHYQLARSYLAL